MAEGLLPNTQAEKVPPSKLNWQTLPLGPMLIIYSFLDRMDQYNMSQLSEQWSEGFNSPDLWESFAFALTENQIFENPWPFWEAVEKNSGVFRHVYIQYCMRTTNMGLIGTWIEKFSRFMRILTTNSQVISIDFQDLAFLFITGHNPSYRNVCRVIADFLDTQHQLVRVKCFHCSFQYYNGARFLLKLVRHCRNSLSHLVLPTFVRDGPKENERECILSILLHLPMLESLEIDYQFVLGENADRSIVIEKLQYCRKQLNLKMFLYVDEVSRNYKRLTARNWRDLVDRKTNLKLEVHVVALSRCRALNEVFIVPNMPITQMFFRFRGDSFWEIGQFFDYLHYCRTFKNLVRFRLDLESPIPDLSKNFHPFLIKCRRLKQIHLNVVYPVFGLNIFLLSLAQNRPKSLEKFQLNISGIGNVFYKIVLEKLISKFVQVLNLEVNLKI